MKNDQKYNARYSRRHFLQSLLGAGIGGSLGTIGQLGLMQQVSAAVAPEFSDYKAMVCILLNGGNDSFNMLVPYGSAPGGAYNDYADVRGELAVANKALNLSTVSAAGGNLNNSPLSGGSGNPYYTGDNIATAYKKGLYSLADKSIPLAVNSLMPELAQLITDDKVSILSNIGNLVEPVSRREIFDETANLPLFLFAHNHQKRALETGRGDSLTDIGWAGRIADNWPGINNNHPLGLNVSYAGNNSMMLGATTTPLVLEAGVPPEFVDMEYRSGRAENERRALFTAMAGRENTAVGGGIIFGTERTAHTTNPFRQFYNRSLLKSMRVFDELSETWPDGGIEYASRDSYGNPLFSIPSQDELGMGIAINGYLTRSLRDVATLIDLGARGVLNGGKYNRQIFMVSLNGFDTHGAQSNRHPQLLRELSLGLWNFHKAMQERGHANKVMTYTMSEFGRTMSTNHGGTDHGWGAHHLVMGGNGAKLSGQFKGGQVLGELPDIRLGSEDDHRNKGRIIPKLAQDQLNATLCDWFGVDESLMPSVFPNTRNFRSGEGVRSAYLDLIV